MPGNSITDGTVFRYITRESARQLDPAAQSRATFACKSAGQVSFQDSGIFAFLRRRTLQFPSHASAPGLIVDCRFAGWQFGSATADTETMSDLSSTIRLRRASGRHSDQTEAQAEVLTCTQPVQIGHTWRPDTHSPTENQSCRDTTRGQLAQLPHNHHASALRGRCPPPHTPTAGRTQTTERHLRRRCRSAAPSGQESRRTSRPRTPCRGPDPSTHASLYGVDGPPSTW